MLTKQIGALHLFVLAAILAVSVLVGLGIIVYLDKAMIEQTVNRQNSTFESLTTPAPPVLAADENLPKKPTLGAAEPEQTDPQNTAPNK